MTENLVINGLLFVLITICLYTDLKERKIHNKVTFSFIILGLFVNLYFSGFAGAWLSFKGLLLGLALLIMPFIMGGIGAGDVKLVAAIGALKGTIFVFYTALGTFLTGGIIAIIILLQKGILLQTFKNIVYGLAITFFSKVKIQPEEAKVSSGIAFPYGIAIFCGTIVSLMVV